MGKWKTTWGTDDLPFSLMLALALLLSPVPAHAGLEHDVECSPSMGLSEPLPVCTQESPCTHQFGDDIDTPIKRPFCITLNTERPIYIDYPPLPWLDELGSLHYACVFRNPDATRESPRPLLMAFHGGESTADFVYNYTSLREKALTFNLTDDDDRAGYHLISVQGRNLHYPTGLPPFSREGSHHDFYYRDFAAPSSNPDIAFYDFLVDAMVNLGVVDPDRIYTIGHSNGGFMAQAYGIARHDVATPAGNQLAGAAVYGAADPYNNISHVQEPSCKLDPYPTSDLPIYIVQSSCDSQNACNYEQNVRFGNSPGYQYRSWISTLENQIENDNVVQRLIDDEGYPTLFCARPDQCTPFQGVINHVSWPDGSVRESGIDWESGMLLFLRNNPLPNASQEAP